MKIRKKLTELRAQDLDEYPVWEYAAEKGEDGICDTLLLKPRPDIIIADPLERMLIIKTEFIAANGKKFTGFCTPYRENDVGYTQPHIIHKGALIPFWFGIYTPEANEIINYYDIAGESRESFFPMKYEAKVEVLDVVIEGIIEGFMYSPENYDDVLIIS